MKPADALRAGTAVWLMALAWPAGAQQVAAADTAAPADVAATRGEDIVVTAQKREQTLIQVPASVSVIGGETLERQQAKSFVDYAQLVPGFNITQDIPGQSRLILRGINTGSVGSVVATYVDDAPFGASGSLSNGAISAGDFDTFDVARIEVLRGPQGTLYGANSLGGLLKFVTTAPVLGKLEGKGQAGVEFTHGGQTGWLGNAVINVPLGDKFALRASGFYHRTGGYIDAVGRPGKNVDGYDSYGGRASLLFQPTEELSVRLFGLAQNIRGDSASSYLADPVTLKAVNPITGASSGSERLRYERLPEFHDVDYRLYGGTLDWNFGFAALTSVSSYSTQKLNQIDDISTQSGIRGLANALYSPAAPGTIGLAYRNDRQVKKFTQEVRLASPDNDRFEWLVGVYYTHEKTNLFQRYEPFLLSSQQFIPRALDFGGMMLPEFVTASIDAKYREIAGFGSATLHLGERFDITAGGRYSHNKQNSTQSVIQLGNGSPTDGDSKQGVWTWSASPRFEITDDAALYARVAKGYRPGGPNFIPPDPAPGFPATFEADTLISYEAGIKAETADRSFGIDAAGFYVDWDNILIVTTANSAAGPVGVNANGKRARSYGAEATVTLRPTKGLSLIGTLAYTKTKLRDDTVANGGINLAGGLKGDELPFTPRWSGTFSADYEWAMGGDIDAFVGGNVHLQSDQAGGFEPTYRALYGKRLILDGYQTVDLRGGATFRNITVQAYVRNLFNSGGLINAGSNFPFSVPADLGGQGLTLIDVSSIRPRTIGATVGFKF